MNIRTQVRQTNRNLLLPAVLLTGVGAVAVLARPWELPPLLAVGGLSGGGLLLVAAVAGIFWPRCNLVLRHLAAFGPPEQVAAAIDAELAQPDMMLSFGKPLRAFRLARTDKHPILLTPSWLLQFGELSVRVVPLENFRWFYKKALTMRYAPGLKDQWFSVVVHETNGRYSEFHQTEAEVDRLMRELARLLPDVRLGFP